MALAAFWATAAVAHAQLPVPSGAGADDETHQPSSEADTSHTTDEAAAVPRAIPPTAIPNRAREAARRLESTRRLIDGDTLARISRSLLVLLDEADTLRVVSKGVSRQTRRRDLIDLTLRWEAVRDKARALHVMLTRRSDLIEREQRLIEATLRTWTVTREVTLGDTDVPPAALDKVDEVLGAVQNAALAVGSNEQRLFELNDRLHIIEDAVEDALKRLHVAQDEQVTGILRPDGLPAWQLLSASRYPRGTLPRFAPRGDYLAKCFAAFWTQYRSDLPVDALLAILVFTGTVLLARHARSRARVRNVPVAPALNAPLDAASLIVLVGARLIYPRAMYGVIDLFSLVSLAPLVRMTPLLVRRRSTVRGTYALLGVLGSYRILNLLHVDTPWYELGLMLTGALLAVAAAFAVRTMAPNGSADAAAPHEREHDARLIKAYRHYLTVCSGGLALALLLGTVGYHAMLTFAVDAFFGTTYWMLLSLALVRVLSAILDAALDSGRIQRLSSMRSHGALIRARALRFARAIGVILALTATLYAFSIMDPLLSALHTVFNRRASIGAWSISLGDLTSFALTMYLAGKLSALASFSLEQDILPRMNLGRGVPATVSRLTRYLVVTVGFVFAVGVAGVDMGRFAMLASALSVGIGFGLQNVVNNFVSGLMLIFERPVRVGDTVQVGELIGEVRTIGIRASTLRTFQGAEVILPNADLISSQVINWTLSDFTRRVEFPVGVAYGTCPERVQTLVLGAVSGIRDVSISPAPACLFLGFGESSLDFEVRIWVSRSDDWPNIKSQALIAIYKKLQEASIEIPFPQRDLHLRSIDTEVADRLSTAQPGATRPDGAA